MLGCEAVPGRLRQLSMQFEVPHVSDWFLPPAFGSETGGGLQLLAAREEVTTDQILRTIGTEAPDDAWIVVQFRRLGEEDRRTLARRCATMRGACW